MDEAAPLLITSVSAPVTLTATVVVIGAGQAGLSAAYHLQRRGFVPATTSASESASASASGDAPTYVVLDGDAAPGGAWQHRWESLRMATVNGIFDLPGLAKPPVDPQRPSREAVSEYFAAYEDHFHFPILRPVRVLRVDDGPDARLTITSDAATWIADYVINATGTWTNPLTPDYIGADSFLGRQLHVADYVDAAQFSGQRVAVVGGGISAVQLLEEISRDAWTAWYTRREPVFIDGDFDPETTGRDVIARVTADAEAGHPPRSIVSYTGLGWTSYARAAAARGALDRRPMFTRIEPHGVREADGSFTELDAIVWATGFRPAVSHLAPLHLHNSLGGIALHGTQVAADPRIHLVGYGPSQSTVGANRAGRAAVAAIHARLARLASV